MVYELQYINRTILFRKSNTATHRNHVNRERKKWGEQIPLSYAHLIHTRMHDQWPCRGSRVRRYEATNDNEYSTSFSFPSTQKCTRTLTQSLTKRSTGEHTGFGNTRRWNVILQWRGQRWKPERSWELGDYSSNVRKAFCMSSTSWAYSALIFASPSFTGSWADTEIQYYNVNRKQRTLRWEFCYSMNNVETHTHTHLEFHWAEPVEDLSHVLLDHGPSDLVVALSCGLHCVPRHVVERNRVGQNAHCLIEGTKPEETDTEQSKVISNL